ncbi:MAG: MoaD/ThiS family protein [Gammaproteobacteria bacterium]
MSVRVKCFASLRQQLGVGQIELAHRRDMTIMDAWRALCELPPPANLLCARNLEYADLRQAVEDGDEIAFFPPVTGG